MSLKAVHIAKKIQIIIKIITKNFLAIDLFADRRFVVRLKLYTPQGRRTNENFRIPLLGDPSQPNRPLEVY
jgi:hypothetical protein